MILEKFEAEIEERMEGVYNYNKITQETLGDVKFSLI